MKKTLVLALAAVMALSLFGCSGPASSAATPASGSQVAAASGAAPSFEGKKLTFMMSMSESNSTDGYNAQIAAFEKKYGCTVEVEAIPGGDEGENIKLVRLATGALADIYMCSAGAKLEEMDPVNNALDISGEAWVNNISEGYREVTTYGTGIYATPSDTSNAAGVIYNKKVFEELKLEIPETWDEFLACCATIKEAGLVPVAAPYAKATNTQIPYLMNYFYVLQENPDFSEQYTKRETDLKDSAAFVRGLEKMYDLAANGYVNEDFLSTGMDECALMLGEGKAAMMVIRTNILSTMENNCPEAIADVDFFPLPDVDAAKRGVSYWLPMGYVINKNAAEPELAKKWCEFVTTQEGVDAYSSAVAPAGTFCLSNAKMPADSYAALVTAQEWVSKASTPVMEYFCPIKGSNQATICSMVASGEIDANEAVKQIMEDNVVDAQQKGIAGW